METPVSGGANLGYISAQCSARNTVNSTLNDLWGFFQAVINYGFISPCLLLEDELRKYVFTCEKGETCLEFEHFVLIFKAFSNYAIAGTSSNNTWLCKVY